MLVASLCSVIKEARAPFSMAAINQKNGGMVDTGAGERIGGSGDGVSGEIFLSLPRIICVLFLRILPSVGAVDIILWVEFIGKLNLGLSYF